MCLMSRCSVPSWTQQRKNHDKHRHRWLNSVIRSVRIQVCVCTKACLVLYQAQAHTEVLGRRNPPTRYGSHPSYTTMPEACFEWSRLHSPN
jgi:hypothetical protein